MKSKYPEEYSTVDKLGSEKPLASKSCFVLNIINHRLMSYLISKQARLTAAVNSILVLK